MLNNILEISNRVTKGGRVPIKIALLKIHDDSSETNKNGIHWEERYVLNALESAKCMPICASFIDETKTIPLDHGLTGEHIDENGNKEPLFENSEAVGVIEDASIQDVTIGDEQMRSLVGSGYLYYQRYPNFVSWVRNNYASSKVDTSIEIMGLAVNDNKIIYKEEKPTDEYRTPLEYCFSGVSILSVAPGDDTAIVLEVAQKKNEKKEETTNMEFNMDEIKNVIQSTITELNNDKKIYEDKIAELNSELESRDNKIKEYESTIEDKNSEINALTASIEQVQAALDNLQKEHQSYYEEYEVLQKELAKLKAEKRIADMAKVLSAYTDEEQKFAEAEINSFKENPLEGDLSVITSKICVGIVEKQKAEAKNLEINSKNEKADTDDIFSEMCSDERTDEDESDLSIF